MSAATNPPGGYEDQALAYVCRRLEYLRHLLVAEEGVGGDPPELRDLINMMTSAHPEQGKLHGLLEALHQAVQAAGDQLGIWQTVVGQRDLHLPGFSGGVPFEPVYLCPLKRCSGRHPDRSTSFPLVCTITGRELQRTIL